MRPEARVWRKARRAALKGVSKGRRRTHRVETQEPIPGSSWIRHHPHLPTESSVWDSEQAEESGR